MFKPILNISFNAATLQQSFSDGTKCSQSTEIRKLNAIRPSLLDTNCTGPENVYGINMDVYKEPDLSDLTNRGMLYGSVVYSSGKLGNEAVRSQGHYHSYDKVSGERTGEVYQIIEGKAFVLMQYLADDGFIDFYAVEALAGEIVIVPPNYAHATVNGDFTKPMLFGAFCTRNYAFDYDEVRSKKGLAYYPIYDKQNLISWLKNENYAKVRFHLKKPENYSQFGINQGVCIYKQYESNNNIFDFILSTVKHTDKWLNFIP